ncbi:MAG: ice-binding family protein [Prolixibacteraceae bacterium]|nr:ice-binding family protein [Prolixibacteraceae bacterium]
MKKLKLLATLALASVIFITGCKKDDYKEKVGVCPLVVSTIPIDKAIDVPLDQVISATFNEKMDPATINQASFIIQQGTTAITGTVAYSDLTATFSPTSPLLPNVLYSGTIKTLTKDLLGQSLMEDHKWSFTTIAQVTLSSNPVAGGTTTGAGTFAKGASVTVAATPSVGYAFANWTLDGIPVSTTPNYQFIMDGNKALVANFSFQFAVALSSNPVEGGITTGAGSYTAGTNVTVTATPNTGYTFVNWTEGLTIASTEANYAFQLNASRNLVANFVLNTYTLTVIALNGTVLKVPLQTTYNHGTVVNLTATPNSGYNFTSWTGDASGSSSATTVTMNSNKNVTANFNAIAYTLNATAVNGTVLKVPSKTAYNSGEIVVLTATPAMGYTFTGWSGDASGSINPVSVTMNGNKNITANFTALASTFTLNVVAVNGMVVKNPNLTAYNNGASVQLTASANSGFTFTGWSGDATGNLPTATVIMNSNKNVTANFIADVIPPVGMLPIDLSCVEPFAILAGSTIVSTGPSIVNGDMGLSPGSALVGFPPGINNGTIHIDPVAAAAKLCLTAAYIEGQGRSLNRISLPGQLGGLTLAPGLYSNSSTTGISGTGANGILTLDAQGDANAVWIFQIGSTFTTDPATSVVLSGGAQAKNIFWIVSSSATLGTTSVLYGNILADQAITLNTGAVLYGRALARIAAVTLDASTITKP